MLEYTLEASSQFHVALFEVGESMSPPPSTLPKIADLRRRANLTRHCHRRSLMLTRKCTLRSHSSSSATSGSTPLGKSSCLISRSRPIG
uniref:Uncharacterized protein n=1 Tax=Glycine max TaxID=3847 RepID=A0A0R0G9G2_SOYBN